MANCELLLVSPPDYQTREFRGAQPLGIAYLAATLRAAGGIPSQLLDANVDGPVPIEALSQQIIQFVEQCQAQGGHPVVGISVVSQVLHTSIELADRIKAVHPDVLIILGGYHPTFAHRQILADFQSVDLCVRGEGEQTLLQIMQHWQGMWASGPVPELRWDHVLGLTWRLGQEIVANPSRPNQPNLDAVSFPARDLLPPLSAYPPYADTVAGKMRLKASVMSSRGCPFNCNFCSIISFYGDAGGKPWRGRSVENVVAEMVELAQVHGASHFEFQDDNFFVRPERALAIVEAFAQAGIDFSFAFLTRADQIVRGEHYFPALRRAGLRYVSVGIESGSEASLERMVKQTGVEANRRALQILHENDVAAQVEFIMFEPGTTLADLEQNLKFIKDQGLFGYFPPLIFTSLLLLPGTPVREQLERDAGLQGSIHESLAYQFQDEGVVQVNELLTRFQESLGGRWYDLAFRLLDGIPALEIGLAQNGHEGGAHPSPRQLAELKLEFFALTRIPYRLLQGALNAASAGQPVPMADLLRRAEVDYQQVSERLQVLGQPQP